MRGEVKLFYSPGACSLGIHVLLEEIGAPYETALVSTRAGDQNTPEYLKVNPKARVPALLLDEGGVLTQYVAISLYLAMRYPQARLMPDDTLAQARAVELMDYVVGTLHGHGFRLIFRPQSLGANEASMEHARQEGRAIVEKGLGLVADAIPQNGLNVADAALFYVERWAEAAEIVMPPAASAHLARMRARPAVQRVLAAERIA